MSDSRNTQTRASLSEEEVLEIRRRRLARTKFGVFFVVAGIVGFAAAVAGLLLLETPMTTGLAIIAVSFGAAAVGAGYADFNEVRGFFGR